MLESAVGTRKNAYASSPDDESRRCTELFKSVLHLMM